MALFGEVYMQHYHIGKRGASLFKKLLYVRHRLAKLLVDSFTDDAGMRVSAYLSPIAKIFPRWISCECGPTGGRALTPEIAIDSIFASFCVASTLGLARSRCSRGVADLRFGGKLSEDG
jgi:hypothetical protein